MPLQHKSCEASLKDIHTLDTADYRNLSLLPFGLDNRRFKQDGIPYTHRSDELRACRAEYHIGVVYRAHRRIVRCTEKKPTVHQPLCIRRHLSGRMEQSFCIIVGEFGKLSTQCRLDREVGLQYRHDLSFFRKDYIKKC